MKGNSLKIKRFGILLITFVLLAAVVAALINARYLKKADMKNTLKPAVPVTPEVVEDFKDNVKKDVKFEVGDTGYPVYVRAEIIITWKDTNGNVYFMKPEEGTHYTIDLNTDDWEERADGFYYLIDSEKSSADNAVLKAVESKGVTDVLIRRCAPTGAAAPAPGYTLSVEIVVQTVQAVGTTDDDQFDAWQDAWNYSLETP